MVDIVDIIMIAIFIFMISFPFVFLFMYHPIGKTNYCGTLSSILEADRDSNKPINQNVLSNYTKSCSN